MVSLSLIEPHLTRENGGELIQQVMGKNKEEIEYLISQYFGKVEKSSKDKIRRLAVSVPSVSKRPALPLKHVQDVPPAEIPSKEGEKNSLQADMHKWHK